MRWLLLSLSVVSPAQDAGRTESKLPPEIFQTWVHSFEEDPKPEGPRPVQVFRPSAYAFPRARGRGGFEVRENGIFVSHEPGRTDRGESMRGEWTATDPTCLEVSFPDQPRKTRIQIVSLTSQVLRVRRWQDRESAVSDR